MEVANSPRQRDLANRFAQTVLPHLDAGYNLARWLTRNDSDAQDVVQEASARSLQYLDTCRGNNVRAWFLTIVRRTCYTWLEKNHPRDEIGSDDVLQNVEDPNAAPESALFDKLDRDTLHAALEELPPVFREAIVLRELEGLSYREIAEIGGISIGTVMSRLARGRERLKQLLIRRMDKEHEHDLR